MLRVLIDATGVTRKKAGVGVYAKNLVEGLVLTGSMELFLVVQDDDPDFDYTGVPHVTVLRMPSSLLRKVPLRLLFEQTVLPLLLLRHRIDVVHSLHYSFPLFRFGARSAVTIHDMTSILMPELHIGIKASYYRFFLRRARRLTDALIFVSRSAQSDFFATFGPTRGFCTVVYHGKDACFQPCNDEVLLAPMRAIYELPRRYILYVGTIEPRKNLERLVHAFATVAQKHPGVALVIAGMIGWKQDHLLNVVRSLGPGVRILFPGFVAEEHKPLLIAGCELFAYPSLYEGFGLPVLEALASGVPTVTGNTSSLPEVAGNAALLVNPEDTSAIADALEAILSNTTLAAELRQRGPVQAAQFTWQRTAEQTFAVYKKLAAQA